MRVRITRMRLAAAGLLVLAGIGLSSLLSPLIGTALATVGQTVNISDASSSAFFAKVTSAGELKTNGVVSGKVAPALPPQPFNVVRTIKVSSGAVFVLGPTTATVALTDVTFANFFANGARELLLIQDSASAPNAGCMKTRTHLVGFYDAASAQTVVQDLATPVVLKPLASGDAWCLTASLSAPAGEVDNVAYLTLGGYVVSGTFTPPNAPPPGKTGVVPKRAG